MTPKQWEALKEELQGFVNLKLKKAESTEAFARRLALKANSQISDDDWNTMSDDTQTWVNETLEAIDKGNVIDLPEGEHDDPPAAKATGKRGQAKGKGNSKGKGKGKSKGAAANAGRPGRYPADAKITVIMKKNPHRAGTRAHEYYASYKKGGTVADALQAGVTFSYMAWQVERDIIKITGGTAE